MCGVKGVIFFGKVCNIAGLAIVRSRVTVENGGKVHSREESEAFIQLFVFELKLRREAEREIAIRVATE